MEYILVLIMIFSFSVTLSVIFKKRIEQVIPIGVVEIIVIIYVAGLFDNLQLGTNIVQALTIINLLCFARMAVKEYKKNKFEELVKNIATPGLIIYILLFIVSGVINKNRIFHDYDEFNHWAVIIKNMFMYNSYGTNPENVVRFNEYPPFTAVFQYLFLSIQKVYREDIIIIAQNVLYFSIIIPITKNIRWNKSIKNILTIVPIIIFLPMMFYKNFFLDILVDGILGIMFAYTIFSAFEDEKNIKFKYLKILSGEIMLCLTKTSGLGLAVLSIIIILIRCIIDRKKDNSNFKKEIRAIITVILIVALFTSLWYIKVSRAEKRWDFEQYIEVNNKSKEEQETISKKFIAFLFLHDEITERCFTVISVILIFTCIQAYTIKKVNEKKYTYYTYSMLISILIYLISLLITYATIFDVAEAHYLTCFSRYTSTILLAYLAFQVYVLSERKIKNYKKHVLLIVTIIIATIPMDNIEEKYIRGKNYIVTSNINRDIYTKIKGYEENLKVTDKILYIVGTKGNGEYLESLNEYVMMPIRIEDTTAGVYKTKEKFEEVAKKYTHIFIYRMQAETKEVIKGAFKNENVENDKLYRVKLENDNVLLETVK